MTIGILKEPQFDKRVSLLPQQCIYFKEKNIEVLVEENAGKNAFASNDEYISAGATVTSRNDVIAKSEVLLFIHPIGSNELAAAKKNSVCIGAYNPLMNVSILQEWLHQPLTVFSLDMLPRTTRAQSMDILSSQANIAGYKAVIEAAYFFPRYFPMFMTAAGSISPAKVMIVGAGVAGLQAIATARRLGAVVEVFDTRAAVKEEVKSLGAKFIEVEGAADTKAAGGYAVEQSKDFLDRQKQKIAESAAKADIIITTAQIPGKKAPVLITETMINAMKPGSVIIDLAASTGGNTELTQNNKTIHHNQVSIIGNSLLQSSMPMDASKLYGKNIINFFSLLLSKNNSIELNFEDDLVKGSCIMHDGNIINESIKQLIK